jgi:cytoskeletal protein CcmA (bactofilin family)
MANTVIGNTIVIDGEISGDEDLTIRGTVKGRISLSASLFVENSGNVEADIEASEKVELKADGRMVGDIKAPRILIADGATFKGNVDMER